MFMGLSSVPRGRKEALPLETETLRKPRLDQLATSRDTGRFDAPVDDYSAWLARSRPIVIEGFPGTRPRIGLSAALLTS